jgi:hypothetical protein
MLLHISHRFGGTMSTTLTSGRYLCRGFLEQMARMSSPSHDVETLLLCELCELLISWSYVFHVTWTNPVLVGKHVCYIGDHIWRRRQLPIMILSRRLPYILIICHKFSILKLLCIWSSISGQIHLHSSRLSWEHRLLYREKTLYDYEWCCLICLYDTGVGFMAQFPPNKQIRYCYTVSHL